MKLKYAALLLVGITLSGCFERTYGVTCPKNAEYDAEFLARAEAELEKASPEIQKLVADYGGMRDAARACEQLQTKFSPESYR